MRGRRSDAWEWLVGDVAGQTAVVTCTLLYGVHTCDQSLRQNTFVGELCGCKLKKFPPAARNVDLKITHRGNTPRASGNNGRRESWTDQTHAHLIHVLNKCELVPTIIPVSSSSSRAVSSPISPRCHSLAPMSLVRTPLSSHGGCLLQCWEIEHTTQLSLKVFFATDGCRFGYYRAGSCV